VFIERLRPYEVTLVPKHAGEVVETPCYLGILGFEHLLEDCQGALEERPRCRKVAPGLQQDGEVVEVRRRIGMLGTEQLLADRYGRPLLPPTNV
jgi:hypothetical protein